MSNPHEDGGLSVTFKQEAKDGMWMVFHGSPAKQREQILEAFGFNPADYADDTLVSIANEANKTYKALTTAGRVLGGRQIGKPNSDEWDAAAQRRDAQPAEPEKDPLFAAIEAIDSIPDLKALWAANRDQLDKNRDTHVPELVLAWNARGKAIKAAAG